MDALSDEVKAMFSKVCGIPEDKVDLDANLFKEYGINSVKAIKLLSNLEVHYDIDIPDTAAQSMTCLKDVVRIVRELQAVAS